jgi:hypothetical protein
VGRPRRRWVDKIKMDFGEIGCCGADSIVLAQDGDKWRALVNVTMNLRVPRNIGLLAALLTVLSSPAELQRVNSLVGWLVGWLARLLDGFLVVWLAGWFVR